MRDDGAQNGTQDGAGNGTRHGAGDGAATRGDPLRAEAPELPAPGRAPRRRAGWAVALKLAVSSALIAWIVAGADLGQTIAALRAADAGWLGAAAALQFVGSAVITSRWQGLLAAQAVRPGWPRLFVSVLVSGFFRQFMPSTIGGDVIRGYDAWRAGASPSLAVTSLVVDRLLGLIALALFVLIALALSEGIAEQVPGLWAWVGLGSAGLLAVLGLMVLPGGAAGRGLRRAIGRLPGPLGRPLLKVIEAIRLYRGQPLALLRGFALSIVLQLNVVTFYWMLARALGLGLGLDDLFIVVPLATVVMMAPISINGIGLRESIFIFLLGLWSVPPAAALAFAWAEFSLFLGFGLFGGLVYALRKG